MDFFNWLNEGIKEQEQRVKDKIKSVFPELNDVAVEMLLSYFVQIENDISSEEDKRRGSTLWKFLNNLKKVPNESLAHTKDRLCMEFRKLVNKVNYKDPNTRLKNVTEEIKKQLPDISEQIALELANRAIKNNISLNKIIQDYTKSLQGDKEFAPIVEDGNIKIYYVNRFYPHDNTEKHIDTGEKQPCHIMFKGTKWCVRFQDYFMRYVSPSDNNPLVLVKINDKPFALGQKNEFFKDAEDEDLSDQAMTMIAPALLKTNNIFISEQASPFLESGFFKYLQELNDESLKLLGKRWFNSTNCKFYQNHFVLEEFDWEELNDMLKGVLPDVDEVISHYDSGYDNKYFIDELNYSNDNLIEDYLEENVDKKPEDWEDMELIQKIEYDNDLFDRITQIAYDNLSASTHKKVVEKIVDLLSESPLYVLYMDGMFKICLQEMEGQMTLRESLRGEIETKDIVELRIEDIKSNFKNMHVEQDFDSKSFNEEIKKMMQELQQNK